MRRIVLERNPRRSQLPPYTEINHKEIREAAAGWDASRAARETTRRDVIELEQTREAAEWRDAEAAEKARAEGKAEPKRSQVAEHDKKLDAATHEHRVATLAEKRAFDDLQHALDEHQAEWVESIERDVAMLDDRWEDAMKTVAEIHAQRARVLAFRAMVVGGEQPSANTVALQPAKIKGVDFASGAGRQTAYVATGDVLAALSILGKPEPVEKPVEEALPVSVSAGDFFS